MPMAAERDHHGRDVARLIGEDREGEAQHGVERSLAGEHHYGRGGCFANRVDQPSVQRENGHLDRERQQEAERGKPQRGSVGRDRVLRCESGERGQIEGSGLRVKPQHRDQQQPGRNESVQKVLDRGATASLAPAEGGDQDRHRHQRQLPESVIKEHVEGDEDAHHRNLLQQEEDVEELLAAVDSTPGDQHAERCKQARQHHQPHRKAIDADVVMDERRSDPRHVLLELKRARLGMHTSSGTAGEASAEM